MQLIRIAFIEKLTNSQASGLSGSVIFNGRDDSGEAFSIGFYIFFLEAINEGTGVIEKLKTLIEFNINSISLFFGDMK